MDASYCTAETLHTLLRLMASRGLKTQQLPRLDLPADALFNRRSRIPLLTMLNLLHWAEQQIGNDTLSLDFGMLLAVNDTDSSFPLAAWCHGEEDVPAPLAAFHVHLRPADDQTMMLELHWRGLPEQLQKPAWNLALSWMHQRWLPIIAARHNALSVYSSHQPQAANSCAWLPLNLRPAANGTVLRFPRSWLNEDYNQRRMPVVSSDVSTNASQLVTQKAANLLRSTLNNPPPLEKLAHHLGLSERTCKRRLQDCGTHYQKLIGELRLIQASYWLQTRRFNVTAVASELGYSSVANFSKAFKKWCGYSPSQVRHGVPAMRQHEHTQRLLAVQA